MFTYGIIGSIKFTYKMKTSGGGYAIPYRVNMDAWIVSGHRGMLIASGEFISDDRFTFNTAYNFMGSDIFSGLRIDEEYETV